MGLKVSATCVYTATATGVSAAALATAMAAASVPVDADFLNLMSLTVTSDVTAAVGQLVTRTIVLALNQPPFVAPFTINGVSTNPAPPAKAAYRGTIRSSSAKDVAVTGVGARTVTINYLDVASGAQSNVGVALNGTTKVALATADHSQITSIVLTAVGTDGANDGDLIIEDDGGTSSTGGVVTPVPAKAVGYAPASFYTQCIPQGTVQTDMIGDWLLLKLQGTLGIKVTAVLPVVYA